MDVTIDRHEGVLTARVSGRIDSATVAQFEETIKTSLEDNDRAVLIDCEQLTYINSAGLRAVLVIAKTLSGRNAKFAFCSVVGPILEVFQISGFNTIVAIHPSRAEALASFGS